MGTSGPHNLYGRSVEVSLFRNWLRDASFSSVVGGRDRSENKEFYPFMSALFCKFGYK